MTTPAEKSSPEQVPGQNLGQESHLELGPFDPSRDYDALLDLMQATWYADLPTAIVSPEKARLLAADELVCYLAQHTFSRLAWLDDAGQNEPKLMGFTFARHGAAREETRARWEGELSRIQEYEHIAFRPLPGRMLAEGYYLEEARARRAIIDERGIPDDDCVLLLVVSSEARGLGLGRRLLDASRAYLRDQGAPMFHLVTDTGCDWQFYEHLGLERLGERAGRPLGPFSPDAYFVYGGRP